MKNLKSLVKHPLAQGSFIVLLGNGVASFLNYLYHLVTGRLLLPEQYGLLESLIALTYFLGVFTQAFSFSVINSVGKAKNFLVFSLVKALEKEALKLSFIFWFVFLILFPFLRKFLHLPNFLIFFIFSLQLFFSFLPAVYLSTLQARLKFVSFSLVGIISAFIKILSATFFILIGWQVKGALGSLLAAGIMLTLLTKFWVYKYWREERIVPSRSKWIKDSSESEPSPRWPRQLAGTPLMVVSGVRMAPGQVEGKRKSAISKRDIYKIDNSFWRYSFLSLITNLCLTSIYSIDVLLVRHYFSSYQTGVYAALSVLGKIIFFAATSVLLVAFPLFVKHKKSLKKLSQTFNLAFFFLIIIGTLGVVIFQSFPKLMVSLLYGKGYHEASLLLPHFAIFISLFALFTFLVQFLLALESNFSAWLAGTVAITQIFLIILRHDNFKLVINNSILSVSFGLLLGLFSSLRILKPFHCSR